MTQKTITSLHCPSFYERNLGFFNVRISKEMRILNIFVVNFVTLLFATYIISPFILN